MPLAPLLQQTGTVVVPGGSVSVFPELIVLWGATSAPLDQVQVWEDITSYVRSLRWSRGRANESARVSAGTLDMVLDNRTRLFDPTVNPNVAIEKRILVQARWLGVVYDVISVFVDAWDQHYPGFGFDAECHVRGTDGFKQLALDEINDREYDEEFTGLQILRLLVEAGFQGSSTSVQLGHSVVAASDVLNNVSRLNRILDLAETDSGIFFFAADGTPTFQDRHHRILRELTPRGTLSASPTSIRYRNIVGRFDDADYWTRVRITPVGGEPEEASLEGSAFSRTLARSSLTISQEDALAQAQHLLSHFGTPTVRFDQVEVVGVQNPTTSWPLILGADISGRFAIEYQPFSLETAIDPDDPDAGPQPVDPGPSLTAEQFLEGIEGEVNPSSGWSILFRLSPADTQNVFIWGISRWGIDTRWGY